MGLLKKYICEIIFAINVICIAPIHDFNIWWNRPVINDGFGYYGYLPAVFIYHDLQHDFIHPIFQKYYQEIASNNAKDLYMVKYKGKEVNKYPPGVAYFLSPFFAAAHAIASISGKDADGYSTIYMVFICLGAVFWQYAFLKLLQKIFVFYNLSPLSFVFTSLLLAFGTNLAFYTLQFSAYSHVYSLFSITLFFYGGLRFFENHQSINAPRYFSLMLIGFSLTLITRNINAICVILLPCMGFSLKLFRDYFFILKSKIALIGLLLSSMLVMSMLYCWYFSTGNFIIDSYQGESFHWLRPAVFKSLFSVHKGWFFYTPVALIGVIGLFFLPKKLKLNLLLLLFVVIYFTSAWGAWDYGSGFSLRAYIDWYLIIGLGSGFLFTRLQHSRLLFIPVLILSLILSLLNILFSVQFMRGIISGHSQGIEYTINNFFRLRPIMEFTISKKITSKSKLVENNFNQQQPQPFSSVDGQHPYSGIIESHFPDFFKSDIRYKVRFGGEATLQDKNSDVFLCASVNNEKDSVLFWQSHRINDFVIAGKTEKVEAGFDYPAQVPLSGKVRVFFWKPNGNTYCKVDNLYIEFIETGHE